MNRLFKRTKAKKYLSWALLVALTVNIGLSNYMPQTVNAAAVEDPNRELGLSDIPDTILFSKLKELADTNNDGKLIIAELEAYKGDSNGLLDLSNMNLTTLLGLGYAKGVTNIDLSGNNSVNSIADNNFLDCKSLSSIILPDTITSIGVSAFEGCTSLKSINLPAGLATIGDKAFLQCSALTSITLPDNIISIGNSAFSGSGLTSITIPNPNVNIGISCFNGCKSLTSVNLREGIKTIPMESFKATGITSINLPASITTIEEGAFDSSLLLNLDLSGNTNLTSIKTSAFAGTPLLSIKLPESLTELGSRAFENCALLKIIKIPSKITVINDLTFSKCINLQNVEFTPAEVVNGVNSYNLEEIKTLAFNGCTGLGGDLGNVTFLKDLNKLTTIGDQAFNYCAAELQKMRVDSLGNPVKDNSGNIIYDKVKDDYGQQVYYGIKSITLPDNLIQLGKSVFANNYALKNITIPNKVTILDDKAFSNCYNLESINFPSNLTTIGLNTFENCKTLDNLVFPESLSSIGSNAFLNCANEKYIIVTDPVTLVQSRQYVYTGIQSLTLPDSVTSIGLGAFKGCYNLNTVELSANLVQLSDSLFEGCGIQLKNTTGSLIANSYKGLESVLFSDTLTAIGNYTFRNCYNFDFNDGQLSSNLKTIGTSAFENCKSLTKIVVPYNLQSIGASAFLTCDALKDVSFNYAANLATIGASAFKGTAISGIIRIPDKVTKIDTSVFDSCKNITSVDFPDGLVSIGSNSFKDCTSLVSITLPAAATMIFTGSSSSFYRSINFTNAIIKPVPADVSIRENSETLLPVKCFSEISPTSVTVDDENYATAQVRLDTSSKPQVYVKGLKEGQTKVTVKGVIQYETAKDPVSGSPLVNRFETQVSFNIIVSAIKCTEVKFDQPVRGLKLSNTAGIALNPVILPTDTTDIKNWSSDNELIAKVDSTGKVTPVNYGSTTIRLKVGNQPEALCQVNVCVPAYTMSLNKTNATLVLGSADKLTPTITYSSTYSLDLQQNYPEVVVWSSSNPLVAAVDQNGNITAIGNGVATITAKADVGNIARTCTVTVIPDSTNVTFDNNNLNLLKGDTGKLTMTLDPADSPLSKVTVSSSNTTVASVSVTGNVVTVTAKGGGIATITATPARGTAATCQVKVNSPLTSLTVSPMSMTKGQLRTISIVKTPVDATDKILYSSSNTTVATVDETGKVTAVGAGTAAISVSNESGSVKADCLVTVTVPVTGITISTTSASINWYGKLQLVATVAPIDASNKNVIWSSSNTNVATVDENGVVYGVASGTARISVKTVDGSRYSYCTITVKVPTGYKNRDVNKDGIIDIIDLAAIAKLYNSRLGDTLYDTNLDVNSDNTINIYDIVMISSVMK